MRILVLGNCQGSGGGPTHFWLLMEYLIADGHRVFGIGVGDKALCQVRTQGLDSFVRIDQTAPDFGAKVRKLLAVNAAAKQATRFQPDLFVAIGYGNSYSYVAKRLPPSVFKFYQELIANPPPGDPMRVSLVEAFDAIAVQSPAMRLPFLRSIPTAKSVISLPCFSDAPACEQLAHLPKAGETLRFVYCGRLAANKGIPQFVEAFAQVRERINATFDIYGGGPEHDKIAETIAQYSLGEAVQLKGRYLGGDEYARLLSSYHALVLPSTEGEGLPLVLLESMSCGLPYLATNIGAIADSAIGNPDVLISSPTVEALAENLLVLTEKLRTGGIDPVRLRGYFDNHYSNDVMYETWKQMLASPREYFDLKHRELSWV